jgi:hypothetical protein
MTSPSMSVAGTMVAVIAAVSVVALAVCASRGDALPRPRLTHHRGMPALVGVLR